MFTKITQSTRDAMKPKMQLIHEAYKRGEFTLDEALKMHALRTAEILHEYPVRPFGALPNELRVYVTQRLAGLAGRDPLLAVINGEWLYNIRRVIDQNTGDIETLTEDRNVCVKIKAMEAARKINKRIEEHAANHFPRQDYLDAAEVQIKDSDEKRRSIGRE